MEKKLRVHDCINALSLSVIHGEAYLDNEVTRAVVSPYMSTY